MSCVNRRSRVERLAEFPSIFMTGQPIFFSNLYGVMPGAWRAEMKQAMEDQILRKVKDTEQAELDEQKLFCYNECCRRLFPRLWLVYIFLGGLRYLANPAIRTWLNLEMRDSKVILLITVEELCTIPSVLFIQIQRIWPTYESLAKVRSCYATNYRDYSPWSEILTTVVTCCFLTDLLHHIV